MHPVTVSPAVETAARPAAGTAREEAAAKHQMNDATVPTTPKSAVRFANVAKRQRRDGDHTAFVMAITGRPDRLCQSAPVVATGRTFIQVVRGTA